MSKPIIFTLAEFLEVDVTRGEMVIDPWLPTHGIAMIAGPRGGGKTMLGLGCALAIAGGGSLLGWKAPEARRVLYCDGEMSSAEMQERCAGLIETVSGNKSLAAENLMLFCDANQPNGIANLVDNPSSRAAIEAVLIARDIEVLFLDNLSVLCNSEDENDTASWTVMQTWLLKLRRAGYATVFLHHTGKADAKGFFKQRGTSKREDCLNTSMVLTPEGKQGFHVGFTKHRGFTPEHLHVLMKFEPGRYSLGLPNAEELAKLDMVKIAKELG
jgi:putative DNA primase/helicase